MTRPVAPGAALPEKKDEKAVETLPEPARSLGRDTAPRTPEARGDETSGEDYLSLMRSNLEALAAANGCS